MTSPLSSDPDVASPDVASADVASPDVASADVASADVASATVDSAGDLAGPASGPSADLAARTADVLARLDAAAGRAGRDPQGIRLLLATKTRTAAEIAAAVELVQGSGRDVVVGENRAQEIAKYDADLLALLEEKGVERHFIGRLQTNKARDVIAFAETIHSVDRDDIAAALERRAELADVRREVLVQVNTSGEESKGGYAPTLEALVPILERLAASERLTPVGLMTIGANTSDEAAVRASLRSLRELAEQLRERPGLEGVRELSMGMSGDLEIAVEEGATIVRVGSAIFGARPA
ncbi:YggS family pyridoxal phosphate-dependent enzyme [Brachybacterium sp. DNPG3]